MFLRPFRFVLLALPLAACADQVIETPFDTGGDALSPKHPEMVADFDGMSLALVPPEAADTFTDLSIEVVAEGAGDSIRYGELGRFHLIGSLSGGKVFKSTYSSDDPKPELMRLLPPAVPKGLALGLDGCKVGERRLITVPSHLAFGDQPNFSHGGPIPPHAILVYEVELVEVVRDLAIKILQEGDGPALEFGQTAKFDYTGVLAENGEQFDASSARGQPFETPVQLGSVIAGWAFGLPGMKVGEVRRLRIPSEMAYGKAGNLPKIGADADLVFDVTLVEIAP